MPSAKHSGAVHLRTSLWLISAMVMALATELTGYTHPPQDTPRTIVSDDFTKYRPKGKVKRRLPRKSPKADRENSSGRSYHLASSSTEPAPASNVTPGFQLGLTIWRLRRPEADLRVQLKDWTAERVQADTEFHYGDYLRLSIESPRAGYLYVIDRDWFTDGQLGETSLIFPLQGDDNRLIAGRLIDLPAQSQAPFRASPKPGQAGEILTMIVSSTPLNLPISDTALPISNKQLSQWEEMWGGVVERFELKGGAGQIRTKQERQAASVKRTRQLTRDDPAPQTVYLVAPKNPDAFVIKLKLSYSR